MPNFLILDALGDGNCLFNSMAIQMADQFSKNRNKDLWEARFLDPLFKSYYVDLANHLLPIINQHREYTSKSQLEPLSCESSTDQIYQRFQAYFAAFVLKAGNPPELNWIEMQKHLAQALRGQLVEKALDKRKGYEVYNIYNRRVKLSDLLDEVFNDALNHTVLSYPDARGEYELGGYFQDHPVFVEKLEELFNKHQFDFDAHKRKVKHKDSYQELIQICAPITRDFQRWFFEEDGLNQFYNHEEYGLARDKNTVDQFALQLISSLYDFRMNISAKRVSLNAEEIYVITPRAGEKIWSEEYRFFVAAGGQEIPPATPDDIIMQVRYMDGHWQATLPENAENAVIAKTYQQQRSLYYSLDENERAKLWREMFTPWLQINQSSSAKAVKRAKTSEEDEVVSSAGKRKQTAKAPKISVSSSSEAKPVYAKRATQASRSQVTKAKPKTSSASALPAPQSVQGGPILTGFTMRFGTSTQTAASSKSSVPQDNKKRTKPGQ